MQKLNLIKNNYLPLRKALLGFFLFVLPALGTDLKSWKGLHSGTSLLYKMALKLMGQGLMLDLAELGFPWVEA
jgi:hypothetical protein